MSFSSRSQRRHDKWRNAERHYCAACNVWMGSDRQSILLHENGKKHKENVEFQLQQRRQAKLTEEKAAKLLQDTLRQIEQVAAVTHAKDVAGYSLSSVPCSAPAVAGVALPPSHHVVPPIQPQHYNHASTNQQPSYSPLRQPQTQTKPTSSKIKVNFNKNSKTSISSCKTELNAWQERKQQRDQDRSSIRLDQEENETQLELSSSKYHLAHITKEICLEENEGQYTIGTRTYLEG